MKKLIIIFVIIIIALLTSTAYGSTSTFPFVTQYPYDSSQFPTIATNAKSTTTIANSGIVTVYQITLCPQVATGTANNFIRVGQDLGVFGFAPIAQLAQGGTECYSTPVLNTVFSALSTFPFKVINNTEVNYFWILSYSTSSVKNVTTTLPIMNETTTNIWISNMNGQILFYGFIIFFITMIFIIWFFRGAGKRVK